MDKMSSLQGYRQWQELFDENVSNVWIGESIPALRNLSMIFFSLDREIKRIRKSLGSEVFQLRSYIAQDIDAEQKSKLECNQELTPKRKTAPTVLCERIAQNADNDQIKSSNSFSPKELSQNESGSIVISDEDKSEVLNSSPEIKKKYRRSNVRRKLNRRQKTIELNDESFTPSELQLRNLVDVQIENASSREKEGQNKEDNISVDFMNNFPASYKITQCKSPGVCLSDRNNERTDTPQKPAADFDFSIVQCTPLPKAPHSIRKEEMSTHLLKKRSRHKRKLNSTLVQISLEKGKGEDEEIEKDLRPDEFKENSSLNSAMLGDSTSEADETAEGLNDFLAKAQNVPNQLEPEPVTKGKARKKLPGWSCKECEKNGKTEASTNQYPTKTAYGRIRTKIPKSGKTKIFGRLHFKESTEALGGTGPNPEQCPGRFQKVLDSMA